MNFNSDDFYELKNKRIELKKEYILSYSFSPGLYGKMCNIDLFVDQNLNYQLFLFWHEKNDTLWENESKLERLFTHQKCKLPKRIRLLLNQLFSIQKLDFKESYLNDNNVLGILDRTLKGFNLNHRNNYHSIDTSPDTIDEKLFYSESEKLFLNLTLSIESWLSQLVDNLMKIHNQN